MPNSLELLSPRNLIIAAAAVFTLSILGMCISMLSTPDSGGMAQDSYGTRDDGHRALVEVLQELGIKTSRSLSPPQPGEDDVYTLVLLDPDARLVAIGPKYAQSLRQWVETGGRVVVSPSSNEFDVWNAPPDSDDESEVDILKALGIDDLVKTDVQADAETDEDFAAATGGGSTSPLDWEQWNKRRPVPIQVSSLKLTGTLSALAKDVHELAVPSDGIYTLAANEDDLAGSLTFRYNSDDDEPGLLIAVVKRGAGEIVVVSDPALVSNSLIGKADNSVLAVNLLSPRNQDVVFDEFYHGLSVRGNPLYLLTRVGFATVAAGLVIAVGLAAWRSAVFLGPPLEDTKVRRRDIGEYVSAMSEFFSRGRGSRRFIIREMRDGVLRQVCRELRLPMDTTDVEAISSKLSRHDRSRADRLSATIRDVDAQLNEPGEFPRSTYLPVMQRLASCL
jgi:hypothetical protein